MLDHVQATQRDVDELIAVVEKDTYCEYATWCTGHCPACKEGQQIYHDEQNKAV